MLGIIMLTSQTVTEVSASTESLISVLLNTIIAIAALVKASNRLNIGMVLVSRK